MTVLTSSIVVDTAWPPISPHAALLSSPSGRRKYQQRQEFGGQSASPTKRNNRYLVEEEDVENRGLGDEDDEDDEETLQLKLAAIEAKLKLKKLQQSKTRQRGASSDVDDGSLRRPLSATCSAVVPLHSRKGQVREPLAKKSVWEGSVEVPLSPTKRPIKPVEHRSPGRVLLGIDKGVKGSNVSLKRARSVQDNARDAKAAQESHISWPSTRLSKYDCIRASTTTVSSNVSRVKSFSERMAEGRLQDNARDERREMISRTRGTGFSLNKAEMESYRSAAAEARTHDPPRSPTRVQTGPSFGREDVMRAYHQEPLQPKLLRRSKTLPTIRSSPSRKKPEKDETLSSSETAPTGDATLFESFSQLHLSTRILPHSFLQRTLPSDTYTPLRISTLLKNVTSPDYELPESIVDYVVFGVIGSKTSPIDHKPSIGAKKDPSDTKWDDGSQNQKKFMVLQLTDLKWSIDLYLFGTALPRYYRLSPGTVVAILNPGIMRPRKGREDTGAFSLTLNSGDDTVLEIGTAQDLGFCKAVKKDGKECDSWVNTAKTEYCEWHLNAQIAKTQAARMGINTGSNAIRPGGGRGGGQRAWNQFDSSRSNKRDGGTPGTSGLLPMQEGQRFDRYTGSQYFIASSSAGPASRGMGVPTHQPGRSADALMELDDDDPFIAEGQLSRDREQRLRKRLATEEKERKIARTLGAMGTGGAGGEYMRQREGNGNPTSGNAGGQQREASQKKSSMATKANIMDFVSVAGNGKGKRAAESVRLSPLKKTRFVTDRGIREAGRDSLGTKRFGDLDGHADEDDLEIV